MRRRILSLLSLGVVVAMTASGAPRIALSLEADSAILEQAEADRGAVSFIATVRNHGSDPVTIAHPMICSPEGFAEGDAKRREDSHGKSEILLTIVRPDGQRVELRDGWFGFFDPGNVDHLAIPPGGSAVFHLGWFFQNARGRWEDDQLAWSIFTTPGIYTARVIFRNSYPRAYVRDQATTGITVVDAWTGELESNEATVEIKSPAN
jgi:hypothetical protein